MPEKARWPYADLYMGDGWSIAYRTLDAQYWGVPQRRRRIYLVADFAGGGAGKILFEREGLRGYFAESRTPWEIVSRGLAPCIGAASNLCLNDQGGNRMEVSEGVAPTLRAEAHGHQPCVLWSAGFCPEVSAKTRSILPRFVLALFPPSLHKPVKTQLLSVIARAKAIIIPKQKKIWQKR